MILPGILIVHTLQWPNAARLALAFRKAGCRIHALCLPSHPLRRLSAVEQIYAYNRFTRCDRLRLLSGHLPGTSSSRATALVSTLEELKQWLRQEGYPAALKADRTWGGSGGYHPDCARGRACLSTFIGSI
jgi:hypothetical protein